MAKQTGRAKKQKLPLLLPREHVIYLCQLPAYRKDFESLLGRMRRLYKKRGQTPPLSPEWHLVTKEMKVERHEFADRWGLKEPIDPKKEDVDKVWWSLPHTDSRVGDPVEVIRGKRPTPATRTEGALAPLRGLHILVHDSDLVGGRRLRLEVDLSYPWEDALEDEVKAVIGAARKLAGAPRKSDGALFAARVHAAARLRRSTKPSVIAKALEPWTEQAARTSKHEKRRDAQNRWKALQQRVSDILKA